MKKILLLLILASWGAALCAEESVLSKIPDTNGFIKASWYPFQFSVVPEPYGQLVSGKADIYGLALGLGVLEQESATCSFALTSGQNKNYGLQCGIVTMTIFNYGLNVGPMISFIERNYGVQISFLNIETEGRARDKDRLAGCPGLQLGVFNVGHGFQIGLLNLNTDSWIPILPLFNYSK